MLHRVTYFYTFVQIFGSKFKIMSATEIHHVFKYAKLTLNGPANGPMVTYSKIQNRFSREPYATPMNWFLMKYLNNKYALTLVKVSKSGTQLSMAHSTPFSVLDWKTNWPMI